ncbi:T7SS effector LXG polymorphic toxin [Listeria seeligeri]|uniref:T7SS effector LXG polymorphic toxin n=1 Tax=Listeria seeligeri TaxID=1640 RepID=UPI001942AB40|nr:T7SS effector LXG polymorphic toxin [Listeria seeligeri]
MGIDMYLGEVENQTTSVETFCQLTIAGMEDVIRAIDTFNLEPSLQGKAYASAKRYFMETYRVLAEGMILLCQDLQEPNKQLTTNFQAEVADTDIIEEELVQQIEEMERLQAGLNDMLDQFPLLKPMDAVYTMCKKKLVTKLESLRLFHQTSATYLGVELKLDKR